MSVHYLPTCLQVSQNQAHHAASHGPCSSQGPAPPAGALGSLQGKSRDSPRGVSDGSRALLKGTLLGVGFR